MIKRKGVVNKLNIFFVDTVIETNNDKKLITTCGLDVIGRNAIHFRIKACSEVSIGLMDITNPQTPKYKVLFGMKNNTLAKIQPTSSMLQDSIEPWSGLNCDGYVYLWVAWLQWYIKAGTGIRGNGEGEFINFTDLLFLGEIIDIEIYSTSHAYWNFDFAANSTNGKYLYLIKKKTLNQHFTISIMHVM